MYICKNFKTFIKYTTIGAGLLTGIAAVIFMLGWLLIYSDIGIKIMAGLAVFSLSALLGEFISIFKRPL